MSAGFQIEFGPTVPKPRSFDLLERLRETKDGYPQYGSGGIDSTGKGWVKMHPAPQVLINPDGPQAARLIEELCATLSAIKGVGPVTRKAIDDALALAAATGTAKTPKAVECEASQSGPKGNAHA